MQLLRVQHFAHVICSPRATPLQLMLYSPFNCPCHNQCLVVDHSADLRATHHTQQGPCSRSMHLQSCCTCPTLPARMDGWKVLCTYFLSCNAAYCSVSMYLNNTSDNAIMLAPTLHAARHSVACHTPQLEPPLRVAVVKTGTTTPSCCVKTGTTPPCCCVKTGTTPPCCCVKLFWVVVLACTGLQRCGSQASHRGQT